MKITNDTITFDDSDVAQLSPGLAKALQNYAGTSRDDQGNLKVTAVQFLSDRTNEVLSAARNTAKQAQLSNLGDFADALAKADDAQKQNAQVFLDQAATAVGVIIKPAPAPGDVISPPIAALKV